MPLVRACGCRSHCQHPALGLCDAMGPGPVSVVSFQYRLLVLAIALLVVFVLATGLV
jgi:hypothetical protein